MPDVTHKSIYAKLQKLTSYYDYDSHKKLATSFNESLGIVELHRSKGDTLSGDELLQNASEISFTKKEFVETFKNEFGEDLARRMFASFDDEDSSTDNKFNPFKNSGGDPVRKVEEILDNTYDELSQRLFKIYQEELRKQSKGVA